MTVKPWERLETESAKAFAAFVLYRDLGADRSQMKVVQESGKNRALIQRWSTEHYWVQRAEAYDRHLDQEWTKTRVARRRKAAERNADLADVAIEKLAAAVKEFKPEDFTPSGVSRLMNATIRMQQLALGGATENVTISGPDGGSVKVDYSQLTDEERLERMVQLRDETGKRIAENAEWYRIATGLDLE